MFDVTIYGHKNTKFPNLVSKRFRMFVGPYCNEDCKFCYYREYLHNRELSCSTDFLKKQLEFGFRVGARVVDFSGGEPTIRQDLPELIRYARDLGYETIAIITNGIRPSNEKYLNELISSGLNDMLISIHGINRMHDNIVQLNGAFNKIKTLLEQLNRLNFRFRTNTVIVKDNVAQLAEVSAWIASYGPKAMNFIFFNDFYPNEDNSLLPDLDEASLAVKKAIDLAQKNVPKITVRYAPLCYMKGYEKFVCNYPQRPYDPDEENHSIQVVFSEYGFEQPVDKNNMKVTLVRTFIYNPLIYPVTHKVKHPIQEFGKTRKKFLQTSSEIPTSAEGDINKFFYIKECRECKARMLCDGIKRGYIKQRKEFRVIPYKDTEEIRDVMYFRGPYLESIYGRGYTEDYHVGQN